MRCLCIAKSFSELRVSGEKCKTELGKYVESLEMRQGMSKVQVWHTTELYFMAIVKIMLN